MNIIVISLDRAKERREQVENQLKKLNIDALFYSAFDGGAVVNPTFTANLSLNGGYRYGERFKNGEIGCTLSHIGAITMAKAFNWEYVIILEDDIVLAEDFEKRIKILLRMLPKDWEQVFLSGIPRFNSYFLQTNLIQLFQSTEKLSRVDTTCAYMIRNTIYDKFIKKLTSFETTTDDLINHFIFRERQIKSFIYFPFVAYVTDNNNFSYISNVLNPKMHESKPFFAEKL